MAIYRAPTSSMPARAVGPAFPVRLAVAAGLLLALSALAFWPPYLSRWRAADAYLHVHAALGTGWLLLLIAQPLLVRARRLAAHRRIGRLACIAGAAFVVSGVLLAHRGVARMDAAQFAREGYFLYLPLMMAALFAAALGLGYAWRAVPTVHARFMACTALPLLDPLLARIQFFYLPPWPAEFLYQVPAFLLAGGLLAAMASSLPPALPGRRAFRGFAAAGIAALLAYFGAPYSATWLAFAAWFRGLPLT
jgi:hypothetical protein